MISNDQIDRLPGADVIDRDGDKVGDVGQVYVADDGTQPLFVTVRTGLFGMKESFVPLKGATFTEEGLRVLYDKGVIKDAPRIDADQQISEDEQSTLFDYYDSHAGGAPADRDRESRSGGFGADHDTHRGVDTDRDTHRGLGTDRDVDRHGDRGHARGTEGHDTSGPTTDDAMTLSEERLRAGTQRVEAGRARLRKHVVTEQQTVTVPVTRDEVRIEREPITDANAQAAYDGPDLSEEEHEVILTEERPVVQTETVPVERVRLSKDQVTEEHEVTGQVRHEEVATDGVDSGHDTRNVRDH